MPLSRIALQSPAGAARGQVNKLPFEFVLVKAFNVTRSHYLNGQTTNFSQADDIQNEAKELSRIRDYLFNELAKNTGQPAERVSFVSTMTNSNSFYYCF